MTNDNSRGTRTFLSKVLAQRIVEELAPVLQENLNLMDSEGFIIASRDASRIGTLHPAAREAAARREIVTVYEGSTREGELPGVNMPLEFRGRVIGVVGVTGTPKKARSLVTVLQLTISLLFEREAELAGESQRDAADRDLLARLVHGSRPDGALHLLEQHQPLLLGPWVLAACVSTAETDKIGTVARLRSHFGSVAVVAALRGVIWVLLGSTSSHTASQNIAPPDAAASARASELLKLLPEHGVVHSEMCIDGRELVQQAGNLAILSTQHELFIAGRVQSVNTLRLQIIKAQLPNHIIADLAHVLDKLTPGEHETLAAFLASGNVAELSRTGYTHRNTVRRRLASIAARTGLDLRVPNQAAVLSLALAAKTQNDAHKVSLTAKKQADIISRN